LSVVVIAVAGEGGQDAVMTDITADDFLDSLTFKALRGEAPTREEALAVLRTADEDILDVVAAASKVRRRFFGRRVKLNHLVNILGSWVELEVARQTRKESQTVNPDVSVH